MAEEKTSPSPSRMAGLTSRRVSRVRAMIWSEEEMSEEEMTEEEETEEEMSEEEETEEEMSEEEMTEEEESEEEESEEEESEEEMSEEEVTEEAVSEEEMSEEAVSDPADEPEETVYSGALALDIIVYSLGGVGEPSADGCVTDVEFVVDPAADSEVAWSGYCYLEANSIGLTFIGAVVDDELVEGELRFAMNGRDVVMPWTGFLTEGGLSGTFDTTWNYFPGTMNIDIEGDFFGER
jgi:hypothetical protein